MKRRNFLRTAIALPVVLLLPIKLLAKEKTKINYNNIKTDGSFNEWGRSFAKEIDSLSYTDCVECRCSVSWYVPDRERNWPSFTILFSIEGYQTHISFAKTEFDKCRKRPEGLRKLANIRFIDGLFSIQRLKFMDGHHFFRGQRIP